MNINEDAIMEESPTGEWYSEGTQLLIMRIRFCTKDGKRWTCPIFCKRFDLIEVAGSYIEVVFKTPVFRKSLQENLSNSLPGTFEFEREDSKRGIRLTDVCLHRDDYNTDGEWVLYFTSAEK